MKCSKCKSDMVIRSGKFGKFFACPKSNPTDNHGTKAFVIKRVIEIIGQKAYNTKYHGESDLDHIIQTQMMPFIGRMTDLDLFIEGGYDAAMDDENHWMNTREY